MMDSILWDNATRDYEAEQHTAQLERARVALAETVPFIVKAASHDEYLDRIALMQDKIEATLRGLASSEAEYVGLFGAVMSSLDEDFNTLRQARRVKAEAEMDAEEPEDDNDAPEASEDAEEASGDEDESDEDEESDEEAEDEPDADAESDDEEDEPEATEKEARRRKTGNLYSEWQTHSPRWEGVTDHYKTLRVGPESELLAEVAQDVDGGNTEHWFWHIFHESPEGSEFVASGHKMSLQDAKAAADAALNAYGPQYATTTGNWMFESNRRRAKRKIAATWVEDGRPSGADRGLPEFHAWSEFQGHVLEVVSFGTLPDGTEDVAWWILPAATFEEAEGMDDWDEIASGHASSIEDAKSQAEANVLATSSKTSRRRASRKVAANTIVFFEWESNGDGGWVNATYGEDETEYSVMIEEKLYSFVWHLWADSENSTDMLLQSGEAGDLEEAKRDAERATIYWMNEIKNFGSRKQSKRRVRPFSKTASEFFIQGEDWGYEVDLDGWDDSGNPSLTVVILENGEVVDALGGVEVDFEISDHGNINMSRQSEEYLRSHALEMYREYYGESYKRSSLSRSRRKTAATVQDVYFPADGNFDASDPIAIIVTDKGNYSLVGPIGYGPDYDPYEDGIPSNPYMSGPYYYDVVGPDGRTVGGVEAYGGEYEAPFDEALYNAEELLARMGKRVTAVRKSASRKRATRKHAERKPVKGLAIYPDKRVEEVTLSGLSDYQSIVGGLIQPVTLSDGSTLYVNEEGLYVFGPDDFNSIATDVAGLGGASHILMSGLLGPAVLVGPVSNDGYDTDVTAAARAWVNRVAREASVKRRASRRRTASLQWTPTDTYGDESQEATMLIDYDVEAYLVVMQSSGMWSWLVQKIDLEFDGEPMESGSGTATSEQDAKQQAERHANGIAGPRFQSKKRASRVAREASVKRRGSRRRTAATTKAFGDLQVGDRFTAPDRPDHGVMTLMCPVGQCRHEQRDAYSAHVRWSNGVEGFHASYLDQQVEVVGHTDKPVSIGGSRRSSRRTAASDKLLTQLPEYRDTCGCSLTDGRCAKHSKMLGAIRNVYDNDNGPLFDSMWALSDGYGEPGWYPPGEGINWSGIRDSSTAAIEAMYAVATGGSRSGSRRHTAADAVQFGGRTFGTGFVRADGPCLRCNRILPEGSEAYVVLGDFEDNDFFCRWCGSDIQSTYAKKDGSRRASGYKPKKPKKQARRRVGYGYTVNPTGDEGYNYDEYQRGQADGWDDGYAAGEKKPSEMGAKDRRHDWQMEPTNDYEQGYQDAYGEGYRSAYESRTGYGSDVPPSWFDPTDAGERWSDDW